MARAKTKHKHYVLDEEKIRRAQKLLGTKTETETIEAALDEVITERERNKIARQAHKRFMKNAIEFGAEFRDVYGALEGPLIP